MTVQNKSTLTRQLINEADGWFRNAPKSPAIITACNLTDAVAPWVSLAEQFRLPQVMTATSEGNVHTLEFTFVSAAARDQLHDAIRDAALAAQGRPFTNAGPVFPVPILRRLDSLADRLMGDPTPDDLRNAAVILEAVATVVSKL